MSTTPDEGHRVTMRELWTYKAIAAALGAGEGRASEIARRIATKHPGLSNAEVFLLALRGIVGDPQFDANSPTTDSPATDSSADDVRWPSLTEREAFVLQHVATGYTITDIQPLLNQPVARGSHAGKSPGRNAAPASAEQLRVKLGARTLPQVVHHAHQMGFLH